MHIVRIVRQLCCSGAESVACELAQPVALGHAVREVRLDRLFNRWRWDARPGMRLILGTMTFGGSLSKAASRVVPLLRQTSRAGKSAISKRTPLRVASTLVDLMRRITGGVVRPGRQLGSKARIWIDHTHMGRRASGIERVTAELFGADALAPLGCTAFLSGAPKAGLLSSQMLGLPACALANPGDLFVFPGYPPSPMFSMIAHRSVLYVHDLFLLTRREHLNFAGKYYMAPLFRIAIRNFRYFLTNSEETARQLRSTCASRATILTYRPPARNVFGLGLGDRIDRPNRPAKLRAVAIGTIEPRKNFVGAADVCAALADRSGLPVELHIIGRRGWGDDADELSTRSNVVLHGFLSDSEARSIIEASDFYLCTSHDEGLGLPLLEVQYAGLPIVAPDHLVFHEVLGSSGVYVDPDRPPEAAQIIQHALADSQWRSAAASGSLSNIERWNEMASNDRVKVIGFLRTLTSNEIQYN
jgi:hypothetical protein